MSPASKLERTHRQNATNPRRRPARNTIFPVFLCVLCASAVNVSSAGPLNPPAGPVAPTPGPEPRTPINLTNTPGDADSLFKITQPGSYYLTANITGVAAKHGVEIAASGVHLDLNGFDLLGLPEAGFFDGVTVTVVLRRNIAVVNGSVRNWGGNGVDMANVVAVTCRVADVLASGNGGSGIAVGPGGLVSNCSSYDNFGDGIFAFSECLIIDCTARNNSGTGIRASSGCAIANCTAPNNGGSGIEALAGATVSNCSTSANVGVGFSIGGASTVTNCSAFNNTGGSGITAGSGSTITGCTASDNAFKGITIGSNCTLSNCSAFNNGGGGISANGGSTITGCTASDNAVNGITTGINCTVSNCSTFSNSVGSGITAASGSSITDCTSGGNTGDGIVVSSRCLVRGNTCDQNGTAPGTGAGISLTGIRNRVEGNTCTNADFGIVAADQLNVIVRNTCAGNFTNWNIVANNICGPILDRTAPASAAIIGNSAPDSTGSTHPNANFSY